MSQISGRIFDIQGFSVHDGPGIRTTVFLKGCPLRCLWCHSPESQLFPPEMAYMDMRCIGVEKCGLCLSACPNGVLSKGEPKSLEPDGEAVSRIVVTDRSKCTNCGKCAEKCPYGLKPYETLPGQLKFYREFCKEHADEL